MSPRKAKSQQKGPTFISTNLIKKSETDGIKKTKKKRKSNKNGRGVVYFSHIPHGFYEDQIKGYCSQFGKVTGLYLPKSKSGGYRGYGFVEFRNPEVAEIVADTMNNYLMFNRLLKAKYIPPSEQRRGVIKRALHWDNKKKSKLQTEKTLQEMTKKLTPKQEVVQNRKFNKSINKFHNKLKEMGLDYEFEVEDLPPEVESAD